MRTQNIALITLLMNLISCAGPMTPFGAINSPFGPKTIDQIDPTLAKKIETEIQNDEESIFISDESLLKKPSRSPASVTSKKWSKALKHASMKIQGITIKFTPENQVLHRSRPVILTVSDEQGIGTNYKLKIYYNKKDVTSQVLKKSKITLSEDRKNLELKIKNIRFLPGVDNLIFVSYQRSVMHSPAYAEYKAPQCALKGSGLLAIDQRLKINRRIISSIEIHSRDQDINPALITGLVAQESSFNPTAVSWAKAIGLTQVTHGANVHVLERYKHWKTFKGISMMSIPEIKMNIYGGRINRSNEWRLDIDRSILGGIYYLEYLQNYWENSRSEFKGQRYQKIFNTSFNDLVLASYNSGPYRVKKSLKQLGPKWILSKDLKEARKYVANVKSYCSEYSEKKNDE